MEIKTEYKFVSFLSAILFILFVLYIGVIFNLDLKATGISLILAGLWGFFREATINKYCKVKFRKKLR
jgi:hypothetical protein